MKASNLNEAAAALFLTAGLLNGAVALHHDTEASNAESTAQAYSAQGNQQQAREWMTQSENETQNRDTYMYLALSNVALAAAFTALGASMKD